MVNYPDKDQLLRFLTGDVSDAERAAIADWLHTQSGADHIDIAAEWQAFRTMVQHPASVPENRIGALSRRTLRIAAIFILLAGVAVAYLSIRFGATHDIAITSGKQVLTETLPDGSGITLNKRSSLSYHQSYNNKDREVQLTGEGFFTVAPNSRLPFIIHLQDLQVEVLGTSFNIRNEALGTEIIVESGAVRVKKGDVTINLGAKEKVTITNASSTPVKEPSADPLYSYYRTRKFVCSGTPLGELVDALNNAYDEHITLADARDGDLPITAIFIDKTASDVLAIICSTLQLTALRQGDTIILKKSSPLPSR
jgi:transmembrane sensor